MNSNVENEGKELNDHQDEGGEDVHHHDEQSRSPPLVAEPRREDDDARDPTTTTTITTQALSTTATPVSVAETPTPAKAATSTATVNTHMSDITTYNKTPSFEHRDEQRSAFSNVKAPATDALDEQEVVSSGSKRKQDQQQPQQDTSSPSPMPRPVKRASREENEEDKEEQDQKKKKEPLPFESPLRYYHQQGQRTPQEDSNRMQTHPSSYHYPYQGYPHPSQFNQGQYYGYPAGYYPPPPPQQQDSSTSDKMSGGNAGQQYHPYYPSYNSSSQGYNYSQQDYHHPHHYSSYYHPHHPHQYYPGGSSGGQQGSSPQVSYSASAESAKDTAAAAAAASGTKKSQDEEEGGEGLDLFSRSLYAEDDRKPSASRRSGEQQQQQRVLKGILKKEPPPARRQYSDYEPIPLHQISAIPVLSDAAIGGEQQQQQQHDHHTAPHQYEGTFDEPFPHVRDATSPLLAQDAYVHSPPASAPASAPSRSSRTSSSSAHVAPPQPRSTPRRSSTQQQQRTTRTIVASRSSSLSPGDEVGSWERRFSELTEFKRVHGHCEVPQNYSENTSLGTWVNKQRMEHKNRIEGKNSSLNDSRLERLEGIGFRWAKRKGQASWDEKFNELLEYRERFGNCHVPTKYKANTALGRWVSTQRAEYKKYQEGQVKTSMTSEKIRRLESIGFAWFMAL